MPTAGPCFVISRAGLYPLTDSEIFRVLRSHPGRIFSSYEIYHYFSPWAQSRILAVAAGYSKKSPYSNPGCYVGAVAAEMVRSRSGIRQTTKVCPYLHRQSAAFSI